MNEKNNKWKSRALIIGLFLLFFSPVLISWYLVFYTDYKHDARSGTQHGILIEPPRLLQNVILEDPATETTVPLHGKWTMMNIVNGECDQPCMDNLYRMRQIRLATGNEMPKLQRATCFVDKNVIQGINDMLANYPGHLLLFGAQEEFISTFNVGGQDTENALFLIDPNGFLMMVYPASTEPTGIIRDLKKLLRRSQTE